VIHNNTSFLNFLPAQTLKGLHIYIGFSESLSTKNSKKSLKKHKKKLPDSKIWQLFVYKTDVYLF